MAELLPCPFCGFEAVLKPNQFGDDDDPYVEKGWIVKCTSYPWVCGALQRHHHTKEQAAKAWNTRADGWYDISTAPRDGTVILLFRKNEPWDAIYNVAWFDVDVDYWMVSDNKHDYMWRGKDPTHWRPIPKAPEGAL